MWIVAGVIVIVIVLLVAAAIVIRRRRAAHAAKRPAPTRDTETPPPVHALDDALRTVESLTDATGSSLLDQVDRDGRTIRDRLASGEAHLDSLRQPDDTGPLLRRVLDEVTNANPPDDTTEATTEARPAPDA